MKEAWELVRLLLLLTGGAALWLVMLLAMFGVVLIVLTQTIKAVKEIRKKTGRKKVNCEAKKLNNIKLMDCPYCGEKASLLYMVRNKKWIVKCWNTRGCRVQPGTRAVDTPEEAAEIWNRRVANGTTKIYGSGRKPKTEPVTGKH